MRKSFLNHYEYCFKQRATSQWPIISIILYQDKQLYQTINVWYPRFPWTLHSLVFIKVRSTVEPSLYRKLAATRYNHTLHRICVYLPFAFCLRQLWKNKWMGDFLIIQASSLVRHTLLLEVMSATWYHRRGLVLLFYGEPKIPLTAAISLTTPSHLCMECRHHSISSTPTRNNEDLTRTHASDSLRFTRIMYTTVSHTLRRMPEYTRNIHGARTPQCSSELDIAYAKDLEQLSLDISCVANKLFTSGWTGLLFTTRQGLKRDTSRIPVFVQYNPSRQTKLNIRRASAIVPLPWASHSLRQLWWKLNILLWAQNGFFVRITSRDTSWIGPILYHVQVVFFSQQVCLTAGLRQREAQTDSKRSYGVILKILYQGSPSKERSLLWNSKPPSWGALPSRN